jgi:coiled-coil domain-containing protein 12
MSNLEKATQDRKARLAKLKSLKRKQPESSIEDADNSFDTPPQDEEPSNELDVTRTYLSGRNYDPETRGAKLGFEYAPNANKKTLEEEAAALEEATRKANLDEEAADDGKPLEMDIFKLQPKKPNWDLKRDLKERMKVLDVRTNNAIARMVKEKFEKKRKEGGEGLEGRELVDAVHIREKEEEEEAQREREEEKEMMEGEAT